MFLNLVTKKTIHDGARKKARSAKHAEHKRYYAKTAFKYEHRPWTVAEDKRVLAHDIPDSELSPIIKRSMKSISKPPLAFAQGGI